MDIVQHSISVRILLMSPTVVRLSLRASTSSLLAFLLFAIIFLLVSSSHLCVLVIQQQNAPGLLAQLDGYYLSKSVSVSGENWPRSHPLPLNAMASSYAVSNSGW